MEDNESKEAGMPVISMFFGIIITMNADDHVPPHIHARYQGHEASFTFDGNLLKGDLPRKQRKLVEAWVLLHAEERLPDYLPEELSVFELPEQTPKPAKPRWTTLYIGKGKKDKLNKVDIVGFLYKKGGLVREDVGQVDVKEHYAFVAVRRSKVKQLLTLLRGEKIKGMKTLIEEAR